MGQLRVIIVGVLLSFVLVVYIGCTNIGPFPYNEVFNESSLFNCAAIIAGCGMYEYCFIIAASWIHIINGQFGYSNYGVVPPLPYNDVNREPYSGYSAVNEAP